MAELRRGKGGRGRPDRMSDDRLRGFQRLIWPGRRRCGGAETSRPAETQKVGNG